MSDFGLGDEIINDKKLTDALRWHGLLDFYELTTKPTNATSNKQLERNRLSLRSGEESLPVRNDYDLIGTGGT